MRKNNSTDETIAWKNELKKKGFHTNMMPKKFVSPSGTTYNLTMLLDQKSPQFADSSSQKLISL